MYVPSRAVLQVRAQCCVVTEPCCQVELGNAGDPTLRRQAPAESNFDGITPATHRETKRLCGVSRHVAFAGACLVVVAVSVVLGVLLSLQPSKRYITQSTASQMPNAGTGADLGRVSLGVLPAPLSACFLRGSHLSIYLSIDRSIYRSICLSVYPSIHPCAQRAGAWRACERAARAARLMTRGALAMERMTWGTQFH